MHVACFISILQHTFPDSPAHGRGYLHIVVYTRTSTSPDTFSFAWGKWPALGLHGTAVVAHQEKEGGEGELYTSKSFRIEHHRLEPQKTVDASRGGGK